MAGKAQGESVLDEVARKTVHGLDHLEPRRSHRWPDLHADEADVGWARDVFNKPEVRRQLGGLPA